MTSWARDGALIGAILLLVATSFPQESARAQPAETAAFNIPPGDLQSAMRAFMRLRGGEISFVMEEIQGKQSPGVNGQLAETEALKALLAGTGLTFLRDESGAFFIRPSEEVKTPGGRCTRDTSVPTICREQ